MKKNKAVVCAFDVRCRCVFSIPGLVNVYITMERSTILKGKLTISMAIFNSYVKLPESICTCLDIDIYPFCICWLIDHDWSIYENCVFAISCSLIDLYVWLMCLHGIRPGAAHWRRFPPELHWAGGSFLFEPMDWNHSVSDYETAWNPGGMWDFLWNVIFSAGFFGDPAARCQIHRASNGPLRKSTTRQWDDTRGFWTGCSNHLEP